MKVPTQERLKKLLSYDPETGEFTRLLALCNKVKIGEAAGGKHHSGYVHIRVDGHKYMAHRLAFLYMKGEFPKGDCDHINGARDDNRWINLRDVTRSENRQNLGGAPSSNKSGLLGVKKIKGYDRWVARIQLNKHSYFLGCYQTPEEAHFAYIAAKDTLHPTHKRLRGESL
jgi:hypothetical protein